jgi:TPR repeat protein
LSARCRLRIARVAVLGMLFSAGTAIRAAAAGGTADVRSLLIAAEAASSGASGAVDWHKALDLFRQALATGDPVASARWATIEWFGRDEGVKRDRVAAKRRAEAALPQVRAAAAAGDPEAEFVLGALSLLGIGTAVDDAAALEWHGRATRHGHVGACYDLAWMREVGRGGPADLVAAEAGYRSCAERGNTAAMVAVGHRIYNQPEGKGSAAEMLGWYRRAAERGNRVAQVWLGNMLAKGNRVPVDSKEAVKWLELASKSGDATVGYDLAFALLTAPGGSDRARAATLLERAAEVPHPWAMIQLGWMQVVDARSEAEARAGWEWIDLAASFGQDAMFYLFGVATKGAPERRLLTGELERLRRSSDSGSMPARALLARYHFDMQLKGEADGSSYVELARSAAEAGEKHAMRVLAGTLLNGWAGPGKRPEGLEWQRKAAMAGDSFSMMFYAQALLEGKEVPMDRPAGMRWLEQSAETGNFFAVKWLGNLLDKGGYGMAPDRSRALEVKRRLAKLNDQDAIGWMRIHAPGEAP